MRRKRHLQIFRETAARFIKNFDSLLIKSPAARGTWQVRHNAHDLHGDLGNLSMGNNWLVGWFIGRQLAGHSCRLLQLTATAYSLQLANSKNMFVLAVTRFESQLNACKMHLCKAKRTQKRNNGDFNATVTQQCVNSGRMLARDHCIPCISTPQNQFPSVNYTEMLYLAGYLLGNVV